MNIIPWREMILGYGWILAICVAAAVAVFLAYRRVRSLPEGPIIWLLNGAVLLMLGIPLLVRLINTNSWFATFVDTAQFSAFFFYELPILLIIFACFIVGLFLIFRRDLGHVGYLLALFLPAFLVSRILFLIFVHPAATSDFFWMWELVKKAAESHKFLLPGDFPNPSPAILLYLRRIMPVWSPLALVFGSSPWVYKISNILLSLASCLIAYALCCKYFGRRAAQVTAWVCVFIPELIFSIGIPTHDLPATFLIALFLLFYDRVFESYRTHRYMRASVWGVFAGIACFALDLQRDYGIFIAAALTLFGAAASINAFMLARKSRVLPGWRAALIAVFILFIMPVFTFKAAGFASTRAGLYTGRDQSPIFTYIFATIDNNEGSYSQMVPIEAQLKKAQDALNPPEPRAFWDAYYIQALLSGYFYNHWRYIPQLINRASILLNLGASVGFYIGHLEPDSPIQPSSFWIRWMYSYTKFFAPPFLLLSLLSVLILAGSGRIGWRSYPPLMLITVMIFVVMSIAEVQPRYSYPAWLILPIYIGAALDLIFQKREFTLMKWAEIGWGTSGVVFAGTLFLLCVSGMYALSSSKMVYQRGWSIETSTGADAARQAVQPSGNMTRLVTVMPRKPQAGDWVRASRTFKMGDPSRACTAIGLIYCPYAVVKQGETDPIQLSFKINGQLKKQIKSSELGSARYVVLHGLKPDADGRIHVEIESSAVHPVKHETWRDRSMVLVTNFCLLREN